MKVRIPHLVLAVAGVALIAAACGDSDTEDDTPTALPAATQAPTTAPTTAAASAATPEMMPMQPGAENMKLAIIAPADGAIITANEVTLDVTATGFELTCDEAGKPVKEGNGHYHTEIDRSLIDMVCTPQTTISLQNVKPGKHTLTIVPAQNDHAEVHDNAVSVTIDYQPTNPLAEIADATSAAAPTIKIISPKAGDTVSGNFDIVVEVQNFNLSCDLFGKPAVAGYGHWHLNFDSTTGPMMGMGTMAGMSCTTVFHASTAGFEPGSTHTLIPLLTDNGHAPLAPEVSDKVEVKIQ
ncbi:MAG: hypothetical protein HY873_14345 [Chloroflexi bacterium]|nr:hypothetical protein [Chloroflexota bacterium]